MKVVFITDETLLSLLAHTKTSTSFGFEDNGYI